MKQDDLPFHGGLPAAFGRMEIAADHADRLDGSWRDTELAKVRAYASEHTQFLAQDIGIVVPEGADSRSSGALMAKAKALGWIEKNGFGWDDWGAPKTRWRSLILREVKQ